MWLSNARQIVPQQLTDIWTTQQKDASQLAQQFLIPLVIPTQDTASTIAQITGLAMPTASKESVSACVHQLLPILLICRTEFVYFNVQIWPINLSTILSEDVSMNVHPRYSILLIKLIFMRTTLPGLASMSVPTDTTPSNIPAIPPSDSVSEPAQWWEQPTTSVKTQQGCA